MSRSFSSTLAVAGGRAGAALRRPHNWVQLAKFCTVGATGYIVNLAVFFALHIWWPEGRSAGIDLASVLISLVALVALMRFKVGVIPVIVACGLTGLALRTYL